MDANTFATFVIAGFVIFFVVYDHVVRLVKKFMSSDATVNYPQEDRDIPNGNDAHYVKQTEQTDKTDGQTDAVSTADQWMDRLEVDRTRAALIELMVYSGWTVGEVRNVVKGDNGVIGAEVEAARKRLGIAPEPPRTLTVRDEHGARVIPFRETEPGLRYEAPPR